MIRKPNVFQKILHRFVMLEPVTRFFGPKVHRMDNTILKLTKGKFSAAGLLGWLIIQLRTVGAKTNQSHTIPLLGVMENERIALIATNFGGAHNPGWYYNLKANPECDVIIKGSSGKYVARELMGNEYKHYWQLANSYFAGYEKYKQRAAHRHIPVMLLEPKK